MNHIELSKEISYALRHAPWEYELEIDENGFAPINQLIDALNNDKDRDKLVSRSDLEYVIEVSDKKRHEIVGDKIRALYGHSIPHSIFIESAEPPDALYHGTTHDALPSIKENGLLPMNRQYVHLSADAETAKMVSLRRDMNPVILKVNTKEAISDGILFYKGNEQVWLADAIPSKFLTVIQV